MNKKQYTEFFKKINDAKDEIQTEYEQERAKSLRQYFLQRNGKIRKEYFQANADDQKLKLEKA